MSLITKYRPKIFKKFVGSETTIKAIQSHLQTKEHRRCFLITGPSGCGKTTLGRIIARKIKALNHNLIEKDTADFTGIDTIREIRRNMVLAPMGNGKTKLYLLDECHQLSRPAQEALLKSLEEPPSHVYFVLCTTEPNKLKTTLKRRCLELKIEKLSDEEIIDYINYIAKREGANIPEDVIEEISDKADGSLGIALSLLDTIMYLDEEEMQDELGKKHAEINEAIDLCRALMKNDSWRNIAKIIQGIKENKLQPESVRQAVLGYCSNILLKGKKDDMAYVIMDCFRSPFYDSPYPQLVLACYDVIGVE